MPGTWIKKACLACGAEMDLPLHQRYRKYCDQTCWQASQVRPPVTNTCEVCGKEFVVSWGERRRRFCRWPHPKSEGTKPIKPKNTVKLVCDSCGKTYEIEGRQAANARAKKLSHHYCGLKCAGAAKRGAAPAARPWVKCEQCNKAFQVVKHKLARARHFCQEGCRKAFGRAKKRETQRKRDRERGNHKAHRQVMEESLGRELLPTEATHHIDGDRKNNVRDNLHLFASEEEHRACHDSLRSAVKLAMQKGYIRFVPPGYEV